MKNVFNLLMGICLVTVGVLFLAGNLVLPMLGFDVAWFQSWRLWPLAVLGIGGILAIGAGFSLRRRGFGALFIPALPVLTTGLILLYASLTDDWGVWAAAWPLVILALAVGFILAAVSTRIVWLGIPAIIIGLNALVLAFCNWTGWWESWTALWAIEPLGVGLALLLVSIKVRSWLLAGIGFVFAELAWMAFFTMVGVTIFGHWVFRLMGPGLLIGAGVLLLGWALFSRARPRLGW